MSFRNSIGNPKLGLVSESYPFIVMSEGLNIMQMMIVFLFQIVHADFDEEDDAFLLTVSLNKAGQPISKPKPKPKIKAAAKSETQTKREEPKPKPKPPPPKKEPPKPKAKPKEDPFFQTEEYEVSHAVFFNYLDSFLLFLLSQLCHVIQSLSSPHSPCCMYCTFISLFLFLFFPISFTS